LDASLIIVIRYAHKCVPLSLYVIRDELEWARLQLCVIRDELEWGVSQFRLIGDSGPDASLSYGLGPEIFIKLGFSWLGSDEPPSSTLPQG
jgi:hypothetical protein